MRTGNRDAAYKSVKNFSNDYKPRRGAIEDNNRVIMSINIKGKYGRSI